MARSASITNKPTSSDQAGGQGRRPGIVASISSFVRRSPAIAVIAMLVVAPATLRAQGLGGESPMSPYRSATERNATAPVPEPVLTGNDVLLAGPVDPATYRVGPGDEFRLMVPGLYDAGMPLVVDAEGGIVLPGSSGRVVIGGLTLAAARTEIGKALAVVVRKREFALSLVRPRRFKVYVTGAVRDPGAQEATPATRVSEVIDRAGGLLPEGSRRLIQIQRAGGEVVTADLAAFSGLGTLAANPVLDGGDVIRVGYRGAEVGVFGGVAAPGIYELAAGETIRSLVALGGGLVPGAQPARARLSHLQGGQRREEPLDLTVLTQGAPSDTTAGSILDRPLAASDVLVIPIDQEAAKIHHVQVEGEVLFPGSYPIRSGVDTASEVLAQAGGFTAEANIAAARISRARPAVELETENPSPTAPQSATPPGPATSDVGRVAEAEAVPSTGPPLTFSDLPRATRELELAARSQSGNEVRASWTTVPLADSVRLWDGDRLYVPKLEGRVRVDGRVRTPGLVPFEAGRELDEYVKLAGGFDKKADKHRVYVQRAGRPGFEAASGAGPIQDGDSIWVPESEPRGVLSSTREFVIFLAQVATIAIVVDQLVN